MPTPIANSWFMQSFYQESPDGLWRLNDALGATTAVDQTLNAYDGTVVGSVTFGQAGWPSDGTLAALFDGSTGFLNVGNVSGLAHVSRFTIVAAWKTSASSSFMGIAGKCVSSTKAGWGLALDSGKLRFFAYTSVPAAVFDLSSGSSGYANGAYHFGIATYDTVNNAVTLVVDGALDGTATPTAGRAPDANTARFTIGAFDNSGAGASFFNGTLDEIGVYPYALSSAQKTALTAARTKIGSDKALLQARAGILRSGAGRSNYYTPRSIVLINGTDYGMAVVKRSLRATDILNEQPDTASLTVFGSKSLPSGFSASGYAIPGFFVGLGGVQEPTCGMSLVLADGADNNRYFGGTILKVSRRSVKNPAGLATGTQFFDCQATDWTWLFNRRTVTTQYAAGTLANLVAIDLVGTYASGFTTNNVQTGAPTLTAPLTFKGATVGAAMSQLCQAISPNWNWYPDVDQDIHFFETETNKRPKALVPGVYTYDHLDYALDLMQIRTRIITEGGGAQTTAPVASGATTLPVDECGRYSATGGTVVSGGQSILITYTGRSASSGPGDLTGVPATGTGAVSVGLLQGDTLAVWVTTDDVAAQAALAALEGGDGIHEFYLSVPDGTIAQCTSAALAELAAFGDITISGTLVSRDKSMRSGKVLQITLPARSLDIQVTIQQVERYLIAVNVWEFKVTYATIWRNLVHVLTRLNKVGRK